MPIILMYVIGSQYKTKGILFGLSCEKNSIYKEAVPKIGTPILSRKVHNV